MQFSSFVFRRSSLVARFSSLVVRFCVFRFSSFVLRFSPLVVRFSSFVFRLSFFVVRPSFFVVRFRRSSFFFVFRRSSFVFRRSFFDVVVGEHMSFRLSLVAVIFIFSFNLRFCFRAYRPTWVCARTRTRTTYIPCPRPNVHENLFGDE